jgi:hypothetical protein
LERVEVIAREKAKAKAKARKEAKEQMQKDRESLDRTRAEARVRAEALLARENTARAETQAKAEAEANVLQATLEATARAAEEARAASAKKVGTFRRFIGEQLFAATPPPVIPESTTANDNNKPSRSKGPIRGFVQQRFGTTTRGTKNSNERKSDIEILFQIESIDCKCTWACMTYYFFMRKIRVAFLMPFATTSVPLRDCKRQKVGSIHLDQVIGNRGMRPCYESVDGMLRQTN